MAPQTNNHRTLLSRLNGPQPNSEEPNAGMTETSADFDDYLANSRTPWDKAFLKTYAREQADELIAIAAVFEDGELNITKGRRDPWAKKDNLAFVFNVVSVVDKSFYAKLAFEMPPKYPKVPYKATLIELSPDTPESNSIVEQLLGQFAKEHLNEDLIMQVACAIRDHLDDAAELYSRRQKGKSLAEIRAEEEIVARDQAQADHARQQMQREEELFAQERKLQEQITIERQRRYDSSATPVAEEDEAGDGGVSEVPFRFKQKMTLFIPDYDRKITFQAVCGPQILAKEKHKRVTVVYPVWFGKLQPHPYVMKELYIPDYTVDQTTIQRAMDDVRDTLEDCRNTEHPNIAKVLAFQIDHNVEPLQLSEWKITILSEYSTMGPLFNYTELAGVFRGKELRDYCQQILSGLDGVEKLGQIYPDLHSHNVIAFRDEQNKPFVKICDNYGMKLKSLMEGAWDLNSQPGKAVTGWTPLELIGERPTRTNRTAIWELGMILIRMGFIDGSRVEEILTSPEKLFYRDDLNVPLKEFLKDVFQIQPQRRSSAFDLSSHKFIHDGNVALNIPTAENPGLHPTLLRSGLAAMQGSEWERKWVRIGILGKGGFGQVLKARNMEDGQLYAVKRLVCATQEDLGEIWAEVRMLAKVNHPGVVRYYNAWQEEEPLDEEDLQDGLVAEAQVAHSVRRQPIISHTRFSKSHDFMEPSAHRNVGPEFDTEDEDSNPFGYQSPAADSDGDDADTIEESDSVMYHNSAPRFADDQISEQDLRRFEQNFDSSDIFESKTPDESERIPATSERHRRISKPRKSTLYIQMELCETATLNDLIKGGLPNRPTDAWRLFKQVLDALAHIHDLGIVHRDLKPANIFIDSQQNPKIGDFGLAVTGQLLKDPRSSGTLKIGQFSQGVGTKYFTAPELESKGSGEYSTKADMFSLGVTFFLMSMPLKTETERVAYMREISMQTNFELPDYFDQQERQPQARVLRQLITHDQNARPSARELLSSGELPQVINNDILWRYIRRMRQSDPTQYQELITDIFSQATKQASRAKDLASIGASRNTAEGSDLASTVSMFVEQSMRNIFDRFGAISSLRAEPFWARNFHENDQQYIDGAGDVIQLPSDLTIPFARWVAEEKPSAPKYYCIGTIFRKPALHEVAPIAMPEIAYDHVSASAKDLSLKDAQVIKVLDMIMTEVPALACRGYHILINHDDLLNMILEFCQIAEDRWNGVKDELSHLHVGNNAWKGVSTNLLLTRHNLTQFSVEALGRFNLRGDVNTIRTKLETLLDEDTAARALRPLNRIKSIIDVTQRLNVSTPIYMSLLSTQSHHLYEGSIMFQCMEDSARRMIAVGGRYDKLIEYYTPPGTAKEVTRAAGFRLNMSILNTYVRLFYEISTGEKYRSKTGVGIPPRVDVVVTSFDEATLHTTCLDVVQMLYSNNIKAELSELYPNMDQLDRHYGDPTTFFVVIVRPGPSSKGAVKVRCPDREEKEIRFADLVSFMRTELGDRDRLFQNASEPRLKKSTSTPGGGSGGGGGGTGAGANNSTSGGGSDQKSAEREVVVVVPRHKSKKVNRFTITGAAEAAAGEVADEIAATAPVVALATNDEILHQMRNTRLGDAESWKALRQAAPPAERAYLQEVQEVLDGFAEKGGMGAFVVNYSSSACIFYGFSGTAGGRRGN